jgi:penicillin-binding protein 1A
MFVPIVRIFTALIFVGSSFSACVFFAFFYFARGLPNYEFLQEFYPAVVTRIYTNDAKLLREYAKEKRVFVPIEKIPPLLVQAFLSAEDKNFYYHPGVNIFSVGRAFLANTFKGNWGGRSLGASTITQQVAKNFLVGNDRSFGRKIREVIMSVRLETSLTKERILELYLNQIYLGSSSYGVAAAAQTYFGKSLEELTIAECAFLASLPKAPATYHPVKDYTRAKNRRDWVIQRLMEDKVITSQQAQWAQKDPLRITKPTQTTLGADYFAEEVRRTLIQMYGENVVYTGGLVVSTTLDPTLQHVAENTLRKGLIDYDRRHGWRGPITTVTGHDDGAKQVAFRGVTTPAGAGHAQLALVTQITPQQANILFKNGTTGVLTLDSIKWARAWKSDEEVGPEITKVTQVLKVDDVILVKVTSSDQAQYELFQIPQVSGGMVVMDIHTGHVLALSGGYSFDLSHFNCATQAMRQPGSAFKPFVYLAALEKGYTTHSIIDDSPIEISLGQGLGTYAPKNFTGRSHGPSPLYQGIEYSRNLMTVRLAHQMGMTAIQQIAERFGIINQMPLQLAMCLGAGETTVLKLATAYGSIVNGGYKITPILIQNITDRQGKILTPPQQGLKESLIRKELATTMEGMLEGVVLRGTGRRLQPLLTQFPIKIGGKTGTTNDSKDAWFMGYIKPKEKGQELVVGIFVGFSTPKTLGAKETGAKVALPVFDYFVRDLMTSNFYGPKT